VIKRGKLITSKNNTSHHGIGTENIKDIVTKYRGEVRFDFDMDMFSVRVVMPV
jgi:sensor histidine kinase regulating citrate/malate metabolism